MAALSSFRDLIVWQRAIDLVELVYAESSTFPGEERYGLVAQVRRAAVSIASNIAEGHARSSTKDYLRFLSICLGSLAELETQFFIAQKLGFANDTAVKRITAHSDQLGRMIRRLRQSLSNKLAQPLDPRS